MGRTPIPHLLALACGFALAVAVATGCGSDRSNLIPSQRAQELVGQLDTIRTQIDAGECDGLSTRVATFRQDAASLSKPVDTRLRKRINDGARALRDHAAETCRAAAQARTRTQTTDTSTTDTTTTETVPTTTTETQTTDTTATIAPTTTTPPTDTGTPPTDTGSVPPTDTGTTPPADNGGTPGEEFTP